MTTSAPGDPRRTCVACGVPNVLEARYCRGCGTVVTDDAPISPSAGAPPRPGGGWSEVRGVAWLFLLLIALVAAGTIAARMEAPAAVVDVVLSGIVALVATACVAAAWPDIRPLLATTGGWRGLIGALVALATAAAVVIPYFRVVDWLGGELESATDYIREAAWPPWSAYLLVSVAPAVFEEVLFRGYVMVRAARVFTATETLLVQAALFSVLHFGVLAFPSHFFIGLVLGVLRVRTGSLYPGMLVHLAWNAAVVFGEYRP